MSVQIKDMPGFPDYGAGDDCGIKNSRSLFNAAQLTHIRSRIDSGDKLVAIATAMGCDERAIGKIKRGERYAR